MANLKITNASDRATFKIDGNSGTVVAGGEGVNGDVLVRNGANVDTIRIMGEHGSISAGGVGADGRIVVRNDAGVETIRITGSDGDIRFLNADFAEEFTVDPGVLSAAVPGTVMSLNGDGHLVPCDRPHDRKVVGVITGAGGYKPALVLDRVGGANRVAITMVGKAYCKATSTAGAIAIGDLLTTSAVPGHAQKVIDSRRALGTVIGKALGALDPDTELIPVLVNLQ